MVIPDDEKTQEQKLAEEITALKTRIKNAEYDLLHMFRGNQFIQKKLENSKLELKQKQKILQELQGTEDKIKQIKDAEAEIAEKDAISLSDEQEEKIEEEFEEEFM